MTLNAKFFDSIRASSLYDGTLTQDTVNGLNALTAAFDSFSGHDHCVDDLAYIMATAYRECTPSIKINIREFGFGRGKAYGVPTGPYKQTYYGRGCPCQLTWLANYQRATIRVGKGLGVDFVKDPDLLLNAAYGPVAMIDGMYAGTFTGKALRNYIQPGVVTPIAKFIAARAIVNGADHAIEIANNAVLFRTALQAGYDAPVSIIASSIPPAAQAPQQQKRGLVAEIGRLFGKA